MRELQGTDGVSRRLADDIKLALQRIGDGDAHPAPDEDLADHRLDLLHRFADAGVVSRHVAPTEQHLPLGADRAFDFLLAGEPRGRLLRQEQHADAVFAERRQSHALLGHLCAEKLVGHLEQNAGAITGKRVRAHCAAMVEVLQDLQSLLDDLVGLRTLDVCDETDATGVVFVLGIVQALAGGKIFVHGRPRGRVKPVLTSPRLERGRRPRRKAENVAEGCRVYLDRTPPSTVTSY